MREETIELRFRGTDILVGDDEPSSFLYEIAGRAVVLTGAGLDRRTEIGIFAAWFVDAVGAFNEGTPLFDVLDSYASTAGYVDLYNRSGDFRTSVVRTACGDDYISAPSLLILDRLVIYPRFRGRGHGLSILRELVKQLKPGAGLIAMKPFPLQSEAKFQDPQHAAERARLGLDRFPADQRRATSALRSYYQRLGFRRVPRTAYMVLSAETVLPPARSLRITPADI